MHFIDHKLISAVLKIKRNFSFLPVRDVRCDRYHQISILIILPDNSEPPSHPPDLTIGSCELILNFSRLVIADCSYDSIMYTLMIFF